jgi:hypothetical protein
LGEGDRHEITLRSGDYIPIIDRRLAPRPHS